MKTTYQKATSIEFPVQGEKNTARYVSDLMVREEALENGMLRGLYWSSSGQVSRWIPQYDHSLHAPSTAFELEIDGHDLSGHWNWESAFERDGKRGTREAVIELKHQVRPVTIKVVTRLDGTQVMARYLEITNTGSTTATLGHVSPMSGLIWNTAIEMGRLKGEMVRSHAEAENAGGLDRTRFSVGYLDANHQGSEGDLLWRPLCSQIFKVEHSRGHAYAPPYWILRNEVTGELAFMALAWSGNYSVEFSNHENLTNGKYDLMKYEYPCLSFRAGPYGRAPMRTIAPGETVVTPELHVGLFHGTLDTAVASWYDHVRRSVIPERPAGKGPFVAAGRVVEEPGKWILDEIDIAAEMGVEGFMVDAGWYGREFASWWDLRGDWFEGDWLPGGLAGIRKHIKDKGLFFGLWHEAEAITKKSEVAKAHPEWMARIQDGSQVENLNLADPAAAKFLDKTVDRLVSEYALDYYKLDHNTLHSDRGENLAAGGHEYEAWRHNEVLYAVYDRILERYPDVLLENCAAGGGRNDLGMMSHFHYACESDFSFFPHSIRAINTMTLFLPPEALCYYHNHIGFAHMTCDADTHLRVTLFCMPIFVGFGAHDAERGSEFFQLTKRYIALYKEYCKPVLGDSPIVYHHTPDIGLFRPADWCVLEYGLLDKSQGYAGIFKVGNACQNTGGVEYRFKPKGLSLAADYDVQFDNRRESVRLSGSVIALQGIPVRLEGAMTSELLIFTKCI